MIGDVYDQLKRSKVPVLVVVNNTRRNYYDSRKRFRIVKSDSIHYSFSSKRPSGYWHHSCFTYGFKGEDISLNSKRIDNMAVFDYDEGLKITKVIPLVNPNFFQRILLTWYGVTYEIRK